MNIGDIEALQSALRAFDSAVAARDKFSEENTDEHDEVLCGYAKWDGRMFDFALEIAEAGESLAETVREVIGSGSGTGSQVR